MKKFKVLLFGVIEMEADNREHAHEILQDIIYVDPSYSHIKIRFDVKDITPTEDINYQNN